jgi:8-oxo-(d)GTP phosphatase
MHLFINDKPVKIISPETFMLRQDRYQLLFTKPDERIRANALVGKVALVEPSANLIKKMLTVVRTKKLKKMQSLTFVTSNRSMLENFIKSQFKIVKAAGGVVQKDDKILLMYRLGKWDFPKGKMEKGEKSRTTAVREVEEECGIRVQLADKIGATWHTYTLNGSKILKKTKWYAMTCIDDSRMKPQKEEGIEQLLWATPDQARQLLVSTYNSIQFVFQIYLQHEPAMAEIN